MNKTRSQKSLDTQYHRELRNFIALAIELSSEMTMTELAEESQLSLGCIHNLLNGITVSPHFRTIYKLGHAIGLEIKFDKHSLRLHLRKHAA